MVIESYALKGQFPPHWLGNLTAHLTSHQIDIDSLQAELIEDRGWQIELRVRSLFPTGDLDLHEMARRRFEKMEPERGPIAQYWLRRSDDSLQLALRAEDRLGFLARLCSDLASLALFPVRVDARCDSGWLTDTLWLRGIGRAVPHEETETALTRFMDAWRRGVLPQPSLRPSSMRPRTSSPPAEGPKSGRMSSAALAAPLLPTFDTDPSSQASDSSTWEVPAPDSSSKAPSHPLSHRLSQTSHGSRSERPPSEPKSPRTPKISDPPPPPDGQLPESPRRF